jgi:hypothetical protein
VEQDKVFSSSAIGAWLERASPPRDIVLTILGALAGWAISHLYYLRAMNDMTADAEERRRIENPVFQGIESVGNLKYARDSSGRVVGVAIELRGQAAGQGTGTGDLSVTSTSGAAK